ncbi:hypothetical protein B0H11DRAFT_833367 [Mycena galericulata]|nr:hypothetical protein B0H11DRAFT_833367 [Mycena galericulata]
MPTASSVLPFTFPSSFTFSSHSESQSQTQAQPPQSHRTSRAFLLPYPRMYSNSRGNQTRERGKDREKDWDPRQTLPRARSRSRSRSRSRDWEQQQQNQNQTRARGSDRTWGIAALLGILRPLRARRVLALVWIAALLYYFAAFMHSGVPGAAVPRPTHAAGTTHHANTNTNTNTTQQDPRILLSAPFANALVRRPGFSDADAQARGLPPLWKRFWEAERVVGDHDSDTREGNGYLWVANHIWGLGWGNALQELLLNAELAYRAQRAFVFDAYEWEQTGEAYAWYGAPPPSNNPSGEGEGGGKEDGNGSGQENEEDGGKKDGEKEKKTGSLIPARVPLSALIGGPIIGAPFPPSSAWGRQQNGKGHPRAVSRAHFERVCPDPFTVDPSAVKAALDAVDADAEAVLARWVAELATLGPCVQIARDASQLFDIWVLGTPSRLLPVWPSFSTSPIVTTFRWSPLVRAALETNRALFPPVERGLRAWWFGPGPPDEAALQHPPPYDPFPTGVYSATRAEAALEAERVILPGLLALHIRRGDFEEHCENLARWGAGFVGFNSFEELYEGTGRADERFVIPQHRESPENRALYMRRCFPSVAQITQRVRAVRREWEARTGRRLGWVYVMTNGRREWLAELVVALRGDAEMEGVRVTVRGSGRYGAARKEQYDAVQTHEGESGGEGEGAATFTWDGIATSRDLALTWEQRYVAQAVDMYIGTRAEVLIGNGFSTLTSNVVMLRMARGLDPRDMLFW